MADKSEVYARERGLPINGCTSVLHLDFNGTVFSMTGLGVVHTYTAMSGKLGPVFTLEAQKEGRHGVIPEGEYWVNPSQMWTANIGWQAVSLIPVANEYTESWGLHRLTIHPFPTTETYGRGGFFIHGGTHQGSAGCIHLMAGGMQSFLHALKDALGGLPKCSIPLTVKYPH